MTKAIAVRSILCAVIGSLYFIAFAYSTGDWSKLPIQIGFVAGLSGCFIWPRIVVGRHLRRQDEILDRIRVMYILAVGKLMAGHNAEAARSLRIIRALEAQWAFGAGLLFRGALFGYVLASEFTLAVVTLFLGYHLNSPFHPTDLGDTWQLHLASPWLLYVLIGMALFFAVPPMLETADMKSRPWSEFYGDRLEAALNAGKSVNTAPRYERRDLPEGISPRELLGLNPVFTKAELRRAWLRLAKALHPDRWSTTDECTRRLKEAALKRVNAARDELMAQAI